MKPTVTADRRFVAGLMALLAAAALGGCVYTSRPNWWSFYEKGISRASEEQFEKAAENFEIAIGERKGAVAPRPKDARRVRTYGMHFIDDYFPHRELGIAYYRTERFAEAERELLLSLEQTPSAKAKVYLNLTRRELLRRNPAQDAPPTLELDIPGGSYLNSDTVKLTGTAESKNYVSSILVNNQRLFAELAEQKTKFSTEIKLRPGGNEVEVEAMDLLGKSNRKKLLLNVDVEYPAFAIENAVRKNQDTASVSGVAADNAAVSRLVAAGRPQPIPAPSREIEFSLDVKIGDTIAIEVTDPAGNTTFAKVAVTADMLQPAEQGRSRPVLFAMRHSARVADFGTTGLLLAQAEAAGDRTPPAITLHNVPDNRIIYDEEFIFEGLARDSGRLSALSVNGEDILGKRKDVLLKYFTYRVNLKEGVNSFILVAIDRAGNRAEKRFQVIRKIQEPLQVAARLTLALLPLQENGPTLSVTGQIYDLLLGCFLQCGRFNFVEREESVFRTLLNELKIGNSALADKATAVRIGRIKSAEGMLYGKTIEDEQSITIDLWLVDTETSEIFFFADVYGENKSRDELKWLVDGLVLKFKQRFPLVRGKVTAVSDTGVFIDNGSLDGIWTGMKYLILKQDLQGDSQALRTIKLDGRTLEARVSTVQPQSCFAAIEDKDGISVIRVNDPVITK